ncbi:glyoxalase [Halobacillus andaensis]|uniref:Glyoxalase n=1 Tax=Halobacillus andaensis TaxID=1176239 RepID=A0A917EVX1_HALAA|nr:VOC family protein [Halobacillus andaensis]MBP2003861.1 lactoylglutathione lyase [Halobacillus andaensis]GGF13811.1 glyoxalase [Halobacillus andaensis]
MKVQEFGLILFVDNYNACVNFYQHKLKINKRSEKEDLTTFDISTGYLMIEKGGVRSKKEKRRDQNPTVLRFDVVSLERAVNELKSRGVEFIEDRLDFDWGKIAVCVDPDGNRIEIGEVKQACASYKK